jgi:hypothetical protein
MKTRVGDAFGIQIAPAVQKLQFAGKTITDDSRSVARFGIGKASILTPLKSRSEHSQKARDGSRV